MTTLKALQQLQDGEFHRLCDDLLRRLDLRYSRLRPHGINDRKESIVGQPDSYVGDSADTCRIAFCYSVRRQRWWQKIVDDVQAAVAASPHVEEIVVAIPRNVDREGPQAGDEAWLAQAKAIAGNRIFTLFHGPEIAQKLDSEHQDLRYEHLGIPYSRLSYPAILSSCHQANDTALQELQSHERYDPNHYLFRTADRELFRVWQRAWQRTEGGARREESIRLIALVNDAGVGKTSLLCAFIESLVPCLPVLLLQARHCTFNAEDYIVRAVVQRLQGVLSPELAREEEAAIVHCLSKHYPLTVVLDGLDEAGSPAAVRRAIQFWLQSRLSQRSILIVSSRREFWQACVDRAWRHWMPSALQADREAATPAERTEAQYHDLTQGLQLPDLFSRTELERAWVRTGYPISTLYTLAPEVREELRHPFTLRAFVDLQGHADVGPLQTRTDIMAAWIEARLRAEEDKAARLTADIYRAALCVVARQISETGEGWVSIDDLGGVPRFNPSCPPGPVVEKLLHASLLESLPGHPDRIRFVLEVVYDFFLGEIDADLMEREPEATARDLADGTFSEIYIRLERLGRRIVRVPQRDTFLSALAEQDPIRAAVVLRASPLEYQQSIRAKIVACLKQDVTSRYSAKGAFVVNLLGQLDCPESRRALLESLPPPESCPYYLRTTGARALARLSCVEGVTFVYAYPGFKRPQGYEAYYFQDDMELLRGASADFKAALAHHAMQCLNAQSGTVQHAQAICVLAYLGDERGVTHLEERLASNGALQEYENHALIAIGTERAAKLFSISVRNAATVLSSMGHEDRQRAYGKVCYSVSPHTADLHYLMTSSFEAGIEQLIQDSDVEVAHIGIDLAESSGSLHLLHCSLRARAERKRLLGLSTAKDIDPQTWMSWWETAGSDEIRRACLYTMSPIPSPKVEQVLIDCLNTVELRMQAAAHLGRMGSVRASVPLQRLLEEDLEQWERFEVLRAIGKLGDPIAVGALAKVAHEAQDYLLSVVAVSLGASGTEEAERVLCSLLDNGADADSIVSGLLLHGSPTAVARAVSEAQRYEDRGPQWLAKRMRKAFFGWDYTVGHYYTHIHDDRLIEYFVVHERAFQGKEKWDLIQAVKQIDSNNVRLLLRQLASHAGTAEDAVVQVEDGLRASTMAYRELLDRGDRFAVEHFVQEAINADRQRSWIARDLVHLPAEDVARYLRLAFDRAQDEAERANIIRLLGFFGSEEDAQLVRPYVESPDDHLADTAYEALCRLTDPLLIPQNWGGL